MPRAEELITRIAEMATRLEALPRLQLQEMDLEDARSDSEGSTASSSSFGSRHASHRPKRENESDGKLERVPSDEHHDTHLTS